MRAEHGSGCGEEAAVEKVVEAKELPATYTPARTNSLEWFPHSDKFYLNLSVASCPGYRGGDTPMPRASVYGARRGVRRYSRPTRTFDNPILDAADNQ